MAFRDRPRLQTDQVEQPSYCRPCGITFNSWEALHDHKRRHPQHKKTYCEKCAKDFATVDATDAHRRLFHGAEQNLPCPHCKRVFPRLGGLVHHLESNLCPAAEGVKFEQRVEQKRKHYENWDNTYTRAVYGNTSGDFSLPPLDFSSSGPPTPQLQATRPPQSPTSTYMTQEASDTDLQSNFLDDTELTTPSDSSNPFDPNEDLISFEEPKAKPSAAPISPQSTASAQRLQDDVKFPALGSLSLNKNTPPLRNAWTNRPFFSSTANAKITNPVTPAIRNPWGPQQPASSSPPSANPTPPTGRENLPFANMNAPSVEKLEYHPFDPRQPGFNAAPFYNSFLRKYKCPYRLCTKSVEKEGAFIQHLKSSAHNKHYQCKKCLNHFATIAALTQHSESQSNRCVVRQSDFYGGIVDEITAGIAAPVGLHPDKTTRYLINDINAITGGAEAQNSKTRAPEGSWDRA